MKKILFPTDFADHSQQLLQYTFDIAKAFDAKVVAMHAYGVAQDKTLSKEKKSEMADHIIDVLHDFIDKNTPQSAQDVEVEYIVDPGLAGKEIVDVALDEDINLIVMGMTGKNIRSGNLFGSTALEVISKADCPVLAIPATYTYAKTRKMAYLTDFTFKDIAVLQTLKEWAEALNLKVNCLHVVEKNQNEVDAAINMSILQKVFSSPDIPKFDVLKGNLTEATNHYLDKNKVGIVAMLSRKRDIINQLIGGSRTKQMAKKLDRPILVFKENAYKPILQPIDFSRFSIA